MEELKTMEELKNKKIELESRYKFLYMYVFTDLMEQSTAVKLLASCVKAISLVKGDKYIIETTGPFFYKFRNEIKETLETKNPEFFFNHDFKDQMADWIELTRGHGENIAIKIRSSLQKTMRDLYENNPDIGVKLLNEIFTLYCDYLLICNKIVTS